MTTAVELIESHFRTTPLEALSLLDRVLFGKSDPFAFEAFERDRFLLHVVRDALRAHEKRNHIVASFFKRQGFRTENLRSVDDFKQVPVIPTDVFKRFELCSTNSSSIVRRFTSSGTAGPISMIARDEITLERLGGSMRAVMRLLEPWLPDNFTDEEVQFVNLGPSRHEAGDLWFAYVMALAEVILPTAHFIRGGVLYLEEAAHSVCTHLKQGQLVGIIGPPYFVLQLMEFVTNTGIEINGGERLLIITGGGWKQNQAQALNVNDFRQRAVQVFQLESDEQIRDAFNQVELNSVIFECRCHRKHVPPWVHVMARDPMTLTALPSECLGLLSYLDASAASYPCFIVGDDLGMVSAEACPCGRTGPTLTIDRRIVRGDHEGCATKMQAQFAISTTRYSVV